MATKVKHTIPLEKISLYEKIVSSIPDVEIKGAAMPYTSWNGHMFSFLDSEGRLGLRLPALEREDFIKLYKTKLCEAHGTILKEYVLVPDSLCKNTEKMSAYFNSSFLYVSNLKPKSTKK